MLVGVLVPGREERVKGAPEEPEDNNWRCVVDIGTEDGPATSVELEISHSLREASLGRGGWRHCDRGGDKGMYAGGCMGGGPC